MICLYTSEHKKLFALRVTLLDTTNIVYMIYVKQLRKKKSS